MTSSFVFIRGTVVYNSSIDKVKSKIGEAGIVHMGYLVFVVFVVFQLLAWVKFYVQIVGGVACDSAQVYLCEVEKPFCHKYFRPV